MAKKKFKINIHKLVAKIFHLLAFVLEAIGLFIILFDKKIMESPCIKAGELTLATMMFLFTTGPVAIMDLVIVLMMFPMRHIAVEPSAICYNFVVALALLVGGFFLLISKKCDSPPAQTFFLASLLGVLAGIIHLFLAFYNNCLISSPEDRKFLPKKAKVPKEPKKKQPNSKKSKDSLKSSGSNTSKEEKKAIKDAKRAEKKKARDDKKAAKKKGSKSSIQSSGTSNTSVKPPTPPKPKSKQS